MQFFFIATFKYNTLYNLTTNYFPFDIFALDIGISVYNSYYTMLHEDKPYPMLHINPK